MTAEEFFKGKKITLMGLGLLGRGVGDAKYLAKQGAELIVTDLKTHEQLAESLEQLKEISSVSYTLGGHKLEDFKNRDLILKAAGVPLDSPFVAEAQKNNIPVRMSADLFTQLSGVPVIGITGTRGKSTVTAMIADILGVAKFPVLLGGNVRGVSTLALLDEVKKDSIAVLELDSWQLQGFGGAKMSPNIAVFTTFYPDHLNYYKGDLDAYLADKANIFLYQKESNTLILGSQCAPLVQEKYQKQFKGKYEVWGLADFPGEWELSIPGEHNRYNAAIALGAARALGVDDSVTRRALENFKGVPGRLEFIREIDAVRIYNDTNSTAPDATIAGLSALTNGAKNIVLICGGADKDLAVDELARSITEHAAIAVLLPGSGTDKLRPLLLGTTVYEAHNLREAVAISYASAKEEKKILLFSPAFASFGLFKNEYDRGDQFRAIVRDL